jgi:hypothetical protein
MKITGDSGALRSGTLFAALAEEQVSRSSRTQHESANYRCSVSDYNLIFPQIFPNSIYEITATACVCHRRKPFFSW